LEDLGRLSFPHYLRGVRLALLSCVVPFVTRFSKLGV
jgi:hypothetical protein